jgi:hypothetical protein
MTVSSRGARGDHGTRRGTGPGGRRWPGVAGDDVSGGRDARPGDPIAVVRNPAEQGGNG